MKPRAASVAARSAPSPSPVSATRQPACFGGSSGRGADGEDGKLAERVEAGPGQPRRVGAGQHQRVEPRADRVLPSRAHAIANSGRRIATSPAASTRAAVAALPGSGRNTATDRVMTSSAAWLVLPGEARRGKSMLILGLESSCDETAAALVTGDRRILAHKLAGQEAAHAPYGGVVPEIAARAHVEALEPLVAAALAEAGVTLADVDAIAATAGPGLIGGVMVGLVTGKALAHAAGKPLVAVNHLEGHALSPRLADPDLQFPYLLLLVSGGHCQLLLVAGRRQLSPPRDDDRRCGGRGVRQDRQDFGARFSRRPGGRARRGAGPADRPAAAPVARIARAAFLVRGAEERGAARARSRELVEGGYRRQLPASSGRLPGRSHAAAIGRCRCDRAGRRRRGRGEHGGAVGAGSPSERIQACRSASRRNGCAPTMPR